MSILSSFLINEMGIILTFYTVIRRIGGNARESNLNPEEVNTGDLPHGEGYYLHDTELFLPRKAEPCAWKLTG